MRPDRQQAPRRPGKRTSIWPAFRSIWLGLLLLLAVVVSVSHLGDIERFVGLMEQAAPGWLLVALALQIGTYFAVAKLWQLALAGGGVHLRLITLMPLSLAKLFSDQALPTGGMSGTAFVVAALHRKGIPNDLCMAVMLVSLVAYYAAYLIFTTVSVLLLWLYHGLTAWTVGVTALFVLVSAAISGGALWLRTRGGRPLPSFLLRVPGLEAMFRSFSQASAGLVRDQPLLASAVMLHGVVFLLDASTLWVMLRAIGVDPSFSEVLPSFVMASVVATLSPIPLGLGTFEATCVILLSAGGVPIEAALTATLLLRGFTLWLPMLPGLWMSRRTFR